MRLRPRREDPDPPPPDVIATAKQAFETAAPGVAVCDKCARPVGKRHRC